ncbi:nocturnin-like isoform X2 [Amphibalanus amphitrite]|uniref:nocturnin-like isoform X2 n=1 Tax=Amphibalanus amphitrite TaxID=1232801 RepID=UPI001C924568|nr:nocturnin-like isoform X2 [Amphibalanus amphitrite]
MTMNLSELRESMAVAEQLAKQSIIRRQHPDELLGTDDKGGYIPPKQLLLYIVRMGSFTSAPKILNPDSADDALTFPEESMTPAEMESYCRQQLSELPPLLTREFTVIEQPADADSQFRIMQWNTLSQTLGVHNDNFTECPSAALDWETRRYRLIEEISHYAPDVLCLQEVDHFKFFQKALGTIGYSGVFFEKPDSPCIYIKGNNGPDGCALFFRNERFELVRTETRVIEVWKVQSNQVVVLAILRDRRTGHEVCAVTTHLKARSGALLSAIRSEQGKDLLSFVSSHAGNRPIIVCGDFNAEPSEPVYATLTQDSDPELSSAYVQATGAEADYTTWKIRGSGEVCQTLDYVFLSSSRFSVESILPPPTEQQLGEARAPSFAYPSDHFSLVTDVSILPS